jgi:hypothetical protein
MKIAAAALAAALLAGPAFAQQPAAGPKADDTKVNQLIIYGDDACPQSGDDIITICVRAPERERYRIPENLRDNPNDPRGDSWSARATELQYVGRSGIGSCSPVGPGGMTGCFSDLVRAARAERSTRDSVNWNQLIEEARRERLSRIDAEAEAEEEEANSPK